MWNWYFTTQVSETITAIAYDQFHTLTFQFFIMNIDLASLPLRLWASAFQVRRVQQVNPEEVGAAQELWMLLNVRDARRSARIAQTRSAPQRSSSRTTTRRPSRRSRSPAARSFSWPRRPRCTRTRRTRSRSLAHPASRPAASKLCVTRTRSRRCSRSTRAQSPNSSSTPGFSRTSRGKH